MKKLRSSFLRHPIVGNRGDPMWCNSASERGRFVGARKLSGFVRRRILHEGVISAFLFLVVMLPLTSAVGADAPKRGGILNFVVASYPPSFDGHREYTFAMLHPTRPFYSVLIRVNPENPSSPTDFVGDLAVEVPQPSDGGTKFTFRLRENARFWDGEPVTAHDVVATFNKIIFPPPGVVSARKAFYAMVESVYAEDDYTVTFSLKYPS